jgi:hypothetical protein
MVDRAKVSITTDASGDATASIQMGGGILRQVVYVPDGSNPLATGADLTIAEDDTGLGLLTVANIGTSAVEWFPRQFTADPDSGAESTANVTKIAFKGDLTLTIAQGGNVLSGVFYVYTTQ